MLGFSSAGFSQITIDSLHLPKAGDTIRMANALIDAQMDFQSTGPDHTWDFSGLVWNGQKLNDYRHVSEAGSLIQISFGNFAPVKYKASYFIESANFPTLPSQLPITIEDINQFYRVTDDSMTMVGIKLTINGQEVPAKSDTIETKYHFPITYGDAFVSRGATDLDMNPIYDAQWRQHRKRETEVDGWGNITTPYGTFAALRIHHKITESDSFYVSFSGFGTWVNIPVPESHEYEWRAVEEKEPVLLVKTSMVQGTENVNSVEYREVYTVGIEEKQILVSMYPNPAQDVLNFASQTVFDTYTVYSTDGKEIMNGNLSAGKQSVDVSSLHKGTYMISLKSANGSAVKSFVK